ncbi:hypothetical protein [Longibacter sp.]|uniref:hypothetical protein n=1 Tax=Longibacter sp. TaxID=2045415 RepID=UPI003EB7A007
MSRSIADPLYERLLSSYPPEQAYARSDVDRGPMPDPIRHFLLHLLRHQSRHESRRLRRAGSDWVAYDAPEVRKALSELQDVLSRHARIPEEEWTGALQQACRYVSAYLLQPTPVLTDFVFGKQTGALPLDRIRWRMQFFEAYTYLQNAVEAYAERKNLEAFDRSTFQRFLLKIDQRLTSEYTREQWMDLLQPLLHLTQTATGRDEVPIQPMQGFFQDKGHDRALRRLQQLEADGQSRIGASGLRRILTEQRTTDERAPEAEPLRSSDPAPWEEEDWGLGSPAAGQRDDGATPLWKRFQQGPASRSSRGNGAPDGSDQPLWAQYRRSRAAGGSRSESPREESLPSPFDAEDPVDDARTRDDATGSMPKTDEGPAGQPVSVSGNEKADMQALEQSVFGKSNPPQRGVFVRQLFDGDLDDYEQVLLRLDTADSWGEASQIIARDVFRAHKINIYSDAAVHFTNAVEQRFREE